MFAHVAAALGNCELITEEDSGSIFEATGTLRRPDFRIVTKSGEQFLVEVKNLHKRNARATFRMNAAYRASIADYAKIMGVSLKIAIYWSRWNVWTLVDADHIAANQKLSMGQAFMLNEMETLGDSMFGITPPIIMRVVTDPKFDRKVTEHGTVKFTLERIRFFVGGVEITDDYERHLAYTFMTYGNWTKFSDPAMVVDGNLEYFDLCLEPENRADDDDKPFETIGFESSIISSQYSHSTVANGELKHVLPQWDLAQFGLHVPNPNPGDKLKMWRFFLHPRHQVQADTEIPSFRTTLTEREPNGFPNSRIPRVPKLDAPISKSADATQ